MSVDKIYIIDIENVKNFISQESKLTAKDKIIVFHPTSIFPELQESTLNLLKNSGAQYEIVEMHTHNKNAMDLNICITLASLLGRGEVNVQYNIVSNDTGYDEAIRFMKNYFNSASKIQRVAIIDYALEVDDCIETIKSLLQDKYNKACVKETIKCFTKAKDLKMYHELLVKALPRDHAEIYKMTRYLIRKKQKI